MKNFATWITKINRLGETKERLCTLGIQAENITTCSSKRDSNFTNLLIPVPVFQPRNSPFDVDACLGTSLFALPRQFIAELPLVLQVSLVKILQPFIIGPTISTNLRPLNALLYVLVERNINFNIFCTVYNSGIEKSYDLLTKFS